MYLVRDRRTSKTFAAKLVDRRQNVKKEVTIHSALDHPNVIKLTASGEDANYSYLLMEYASGGELFDRISVFQFLGKFRERMSDLYSTT